MDLKLLENFLKIAELGSLSRAADRLRVAQPALSRQVRLLEDEVGGPLFLRHRRGVQLTPAGEELQSRLLGPLRQVRQAIQEVRSLSLETSVHIALGVPPTVSYMLAGRLARRVVEKAPNISMRIVEGYAGHLVDWLQRGEIEAAILYGPASDLEMKVEELLIERLMLVGPANCNLDPQHPVGVRELAQLPLILPSQSHGLRVVVEHAASRAKVRLDVAHEADSFLVMKELVQYGLGYAILPQSALYLQVDAEQLKFAPLIDPPVMRHLVLGTQGREQASRATQIVVRLIKEEIRELVNSGRWQAQLQY
jgi:LysR family nitrogen assimilation transcriptional regulator